MAEYSYVVGIDPSVTSTGMARLNVATGELEHYLIRLGKVRDPERIDRIAMLTSELAQDGTLCVLEGHGPQQGNGLVNIALHWMIRDAWAARVSSVTFEIVPPMVLDVLIVAPMTLKKFVSGVGNAQKSEIGAHIMRRWGDQLGGNVLPEDAAEAFALLQAGKCVAGIGKWTKRDAEALAKCKVVPAKRDWLEPVDLDVYALDLDAAEVTA
jgi:Holliday junction resolvasome RuvABC endonuclease subunit